MKAGIRFILFVSISVLLPTDKPADTIERTLMGKWALVSYEVDEVSEKWDTKTAVLRMEIGKDKRIVFWWVVAGEQESFEAKYKVEKGSPPWFDLMFQPKEPLLGIYQVDGDRLKVCIQTFSPNGPSGERPTKFEPTVGILLIFQREKNAKK